MGVIGLEKGHDYGEYYKTIFYHMSLAFEPLGHGY